MIPIGKYEFEKFVFEITRELEEIKGKLDKLFELLEERDQGAGHSREDSQKRKVSA